MSRAARRVPSPSVDLPQHRIALAGLAEVVGAEIRGDAGVLVGDAAYDSRGVPPGSLFFCIPGVTADGHAFAAAAVGAGAGALVVERWLDLEVPQLRVASVRAAMGPLSAALFGRPAEALTMVGITGTNGKTTITFLLEAIFRAAGLRSGLIGTTGARLDGEPLPLARTTPEAPDLHRLLATMRAAGVRAVAMEVSSHAMVQHRVDGVVFDVAVFTNLSQDHLDYHGSMGSYFAAKADLFTPQHATRALIGVDDPWGRRLRGSATIPVTTYAVDRDADLRGGGRPGRRVGARLPPRGHRRPDPAPRTVQRRERAGGARRRPAWSASIRGRRPRRSEAAPRSPVGWRRSKRGKSSWWLWITRTRRIASGTCSGVHAR